MVLRITDLRKQYGLDPTFETEEEALAYQEERQASYEERVAAKVQELKDLYNSDKEKYSKFQNFEEEDWVSYAKVCLKTNTAIITRSSFQGLPSVDNNPEIAKWAGFSYVEILQMESDGVLIPKEVLAWAHSMQDSDVTAYEINDDPNAAAEIEETGTNSENSEFKELQKKTQTLSNKSETNQAQINQNFEAFKELAEKAEQIKQEQETTKKDSLKQIEELTKEWEEISAKIKKGDKLTEAEQKRYKELGSMLNGKDGELVTDIQASSDDLQALIDSMDGLNDEITTNIDLGDDTVEAAKQLSRYEKGYTRKTNAKNEIIDVTTGDIRNALQGSEGKDIAQDALKIGTNLIEFSNTLSTQLMMNQYASLYDFAEIFTQTSTETISNTKEVLGDDFNKTTEELNEQIDALPDMTNAEKDKANLDEKGVGIIGQAIYFTGKSQGETLKSLVSMLALVLIQRQAEKETEKSQNLTDIVVEKMTSKKEEADKLTEKKEKAEEKKEQSENALENIENGETAKAEEAQKAAQETEEEEFTEEDQQKLDKLNSELERTGNFGQQRLYQSLSRVDTLEQTMKAKKLDGANAVDYGQVTQEVGNSLIGQMSPSFILKVFFYLIGAAAVTAGKAAEGIGNENNELFEETNNSTASGKASIGSNQLSIQETTAVEAINLVSTSQGENNSAQAETTDDTNAAEQTAASAEETASTETTETTEDAAQTAVSENEAIAQDTMEIADNSNITSTSTQKDTEKLASDAQDTTSDNETQINSTDNKNNNGTSESNKSTGGSKSKSEEAEDMSPEQATAECKAQAKEADKGDAQMKSASSEAKDAQKESKSVNKDSEKTEKQLDQEMKNINTLNEKDTKDIEKLAKDSEKAQQEQIALAAEFEVLNAQNEEIIANQQSKQNQAPAPAPAPSNAGQQGGLLSSPQMVSSTDDGAQATLDANNSRIQGIASRFTTLGARITNNRTKITQKSSSINQRTRKFEKLAEQKVKIQKAAQKKEQEKQRRMEVLTATINVVNTVFSIVSSVGTIIGIVGKTLLTTGTPMVTSGQAMIIAGTGLLVFPTTPVGLAMIASGTALVVSGTALVTSGTALEVTGETLNTVGMAGTAACGVAKAGVMAANGDIKGALVSLGTTIISISTSFIPGVGAGAQAGMSTAQAALQITSASANIVSSTANMAASAQTLAGKEQSAWLNTVSQVAGLVSTATSVAGGFAGGKDAAGNNTASAYQQAGKFGKAMMITQAAGTALSITAQGSTLIKQALGEEAGDFENILNTVGFSLTTAASLAQIGIKISGAAKKGKENTDNTGTESTDENTDKAGVESTDKNEKIENDQKSDDKVADNKASKEDDSVDDASNTNNEGNTTAVTETAENSTEVKEQQGIAQAAEEAADSAEITETEVPEETAEEIQTANVDNETAETSTTDEPDNKFKLTKNQERIVRKFVAKSEGLKIGKAQVVGDSTFEITQDGKYLVNGENVGLGEFMVEIKGEKGTPIPGLEQLKNDGQKAPAGNDNLASKTIDESASDGEPAPEQEADSANTDEISSDNTSSVTDNSVVENDQDKQTEMLQEAQEAADAAETPETAVDKETAEEIQTADNSEAAETELTPEEQEIADLAEKENLEVGKQKRIAGEKFEITEDGKYLVNGEEVSAEDFSKSIGEANTKAEARREKMDTAMDITGAVIEAGSQGLQAYAAIQNLMASPEQEDQRYVLHLSNMKKGKSLIRKIKKRRSALYGYSLR